MNPSPVRSTRERIVEGSGGKTLTTSPVRRTRSLYDSSRCSGSRVTLSPVEESTSGFRRNLESSSANCLASVKFVGCDTEMGFAIPSPESFTGHVAAESLSPLEKLICTWRIESSIYSVRFMGTSRPYHSMIRPLPRSIMIPLRPKTRQAPTAANMDPKRTTKMEGSSPGGPFIGMIPRGICMTKRPASKNGSPKMEIQPPPLRISKVA